MYAIRSYYEALDYRPNQMARGLKCGQTHLIGLLLADITNPYSVEVMRGVEAACRRHGLMVVVCNANNEMTLEQRFIQLLNGYRVDGLIVHSVGLCDAPLAGYMASNTPATRVSTARDTVSRWLVVHTSDRARRL